MTARSTDSVEGGREGVAVSVVAISRPPCGVRFNQFRSGLNASSRTCTANSRAPADRHRYRAVATGDAFGSCPAPVPPLAVGSADPPVCA